MISRHPTIAETSSAYSGVGAPLSSQERWGVGNLFSGTGWEAHTQERHIMKYHALLLLVGLTAFAVVFTLVNQIIQSVAA